ncbi:1-deoxy-D-xylulose-5-phosphate reductoisomerase [Leptospira sp. GIMC2001]|uniref:1-deoxy-D-xylulose-5-phosphate reductoisomerase n=1 Tax=Leptospira sp. GIMC2001 TaxID=1513297 RepID=UPI00234A7B9D|nr:1-deoxy-D-xylulose-5-phosphate reductoisomerase [Leptospira sp. GIMC2001]WCL48731.1 1-deoxy-D-xylulose-5-phosphate reductoisomerase [Leptospira sp. GIMC2001]
MKNLTILGVSGSVGESTLKVLRQFPNHFRLTAISVHNNWKKAEEIIQEFQPSFVCFSNPTPEIRAFGATIGHTKILYGSEGLDEISSLPEVDIVVTAIVGAIGVAPTIAAIRAGKDIAIANKETLVTFGPLINDLLSKSKSRMVPVDSEHNALFQLIDRTPKENIRSLILTASGGSFRDLPIEKLPYVSVKEALNHPTWSMGPKITVDSAGLINKGLEVIEAHFLFGFSYDNIEVVIHPESIIHGLVENIDGAVIAYASQPDMIFPIAHSLFYPNPVPDLLIERKPYSWKSLNFRNPDPDRYPGLAIAYKAGRLGGTAPAIFNASNEVACELFLQEKIPFIAIPTIIQNALDSIPIEHPKDLDGYLDADLSARNFVRNHMIEGVLPC